MAFDPDKPRTHDSLGRPFSREEGAVRARALRASMRTFRLGAPVYVVRNAAGTFMATLGEYVGCATVARYVQGREAAPTARPSITGTVYGPDGTVRLAGTAAQPAPAAPVDADAAPDEWDELVQKITRGA